MRSVFRDSWVSVTIVLVLVGLAAGSVPLIGLGVLVFGTGGMARLWARVSLEDVRYARVVRERRVFMGETIDLRLRVANEKRIPVPWLEVREYLPAATPVEGAHVTPSGVAGTVLMQRSTALGANERLEWPLTLAAAERGFFRLGPTRLRSGDLFGIFEREETVRGTDSVVVYPRTYSLPDLGIISARPFGERAGGHRIFEDPVRVIGVRDYLPGDPLKRVDWNATARTGRLQSRLYEPSRTQAVVVALNISTMDQSWLGFDPLLLERNVVVAASVARWAFEERAAVGLVANGSFPDADRAIRIGAGSHSDQLVRVLEALAMIAPFTISSLASELERAGHALPAGATLIVVASLMPDDLAATLRRLRGEGHAVHVVKTTSAEWDVALAPIPVVNIESVMHALEAAEATPAAPSAATAR
ncbi:MAG: DUF58 domain-containing protein [Dehalococcoidia bacterium]